MIKYTRFFITILLAVIAFSAKSQSTATTSSPYSRYGLGDLVQPTLPQNIGMGGVATAINRIGGYNNINPENPASYGAINWTTIDIGIYGSYTQLSQTGQSSQTAGNFRLSHVNFAIPVTSSSALSFGLMPYTQVGYNYTQTINRGYGSGDPADTNKTNYIYSGDGGLNKAYFGYGFTLFKHLLLGANASYIFGNIKEYESTEYPDLYGTLNSRIEQSNAIRGFNLDYGAQYSIDFPDPQKIQNAHLVFGYSGSLGNHISSQSSYIVSQYTRDASGNENVAIDSIKYFVNPKSNVKLPQTNHFGISYQKENAYLVAVDYTTSKWSDLTIDGVNQGLQNSQMINVGGQITPNVNALNNYWALMDYRFGVTYEKTYLNEGIVNGTGSGGTNIDRKAISFGIGMPLRSESGSFYKINFSAEYGQRGTVVNGLIKENYVNFHLGVTLNDKWFRRYQFD